MNSILQIVNANGEAAAAVVAVLVSMLIAITIVMAVIDSITGRG